MIIGPRCAPLQQVPEEPLLLLAHRVLAASITVALGSIQTKVVCLYLCLVLLVLPVLGIKATLKASLL